MPARARAGKRGGYESQTFLGGLVNRIIDVFYGWKIGTPTSNKKICVNCDNYMLHSLACCSSRTSLPATRKGRFHTFLSCHVSSQRFCFSLSQGSSPPPTPTLYTCLKLVSITGRQRLVAARWLTSWSLCNREKRHRFFFWGDGFLHCWL